MPTKAQRVLGRFCALLDLAPAHLPDGHIVLQGLWSEGHAKLKFAPSPFLSAYPMHWTRKEMASALKRKNLKRNISAARRRIERASGVGTLAGDYPQRWILGREQDLHDLARWALTAFWPSSWKDETATVVCDSATTFSPAKIRLFWQGRDIPQPFLLRRLLLLFLKHNVSFGQSSKSVFNSDCCTSSFKMTAPTEHERLEALLNLRDWLRGKMPDGDIEASLSPSSTQKH